MAWFVKLQRICSTSKALFLLMLPESGDIKRLWAQACFYRVCGDIIIISACYACMGDLFLRVRVYESLVFGILCFSFIVSIIYEKLRLVVESSYSQRKRILWPVCVATYSTILEAEFLGWVYCRVYSRVPLYYLQIKSSCAPDSFGRIGLLASLLQLQADARFRIRIPSQRV